MFFNFDARQLIAHGHYLCQWAKNCNFDSQSLHWVSLGRRAGEDLFLYDLIHMCWTWMFEPDVLETIWKWGKLLKKDKHAGLFRGGNNTSG